MEGVKISNNGTVERIKLDKNMDTLRDQIIKEAGPIQSFVIKFGCNYCGFNMSIMANKDVKFSKLASTTCPYCGKADWF